jgi:hypothetical protein
VSTGCEKTIWDYFGAGGQVVIYDANNGTRAARQALAEKFDKAGIHVVVLGASFALNRVSPRWRLIFAQNLCVITRRSSSGILEASRYLPRMYVLRLQIIYFDATP